MAMAGHEVVDRIERSIAELIRDTNESAAAARTGWVFWMALLGFFVVALAGVTHKDLLLATPVDLPLLQVSIPQGSLFLFGPAILVLVHLNLLMQHVTLARKLGEVHDRLSRHEGPHYHRQHRLRSLVHSYPLAQAIAGPWRSPVYAFFLHAVTWTTLVLLPLLVLLNFQLTYLAQHDVTTTAWHRIYVLADIVLLVLLGTLLMVPDRGFRAAFTHGVTAYPWSMIGSGAAAFLAAFTSLLVATIPDEGLDRLTTAIWPADVATRGASDPGAPPPRRAFAPTAALLEGPIDENTGRPTSPMSRNLVLVNAPLVTPQNPEPDEPSLDLRGRNLRYATFDRSDMRRADLTGADLTGASLVQTGLIKARLVNASLRGADIRRAGLISTAIAGVDFTGARLCQEQRLLMYSGNQEEPKGILRVPCPR
jgi:hypothetical protein